MATQERIAVGSFNTKQPTTFEWSFETTSTEDSGRSMSGNAMITPLFTVEAFAVEYEELTVAEAKTLLNEIVQRPKKPYFLMHYFSPYYGVWRTGQFYVGDGSLRIKTLKRGTETVETISCTFVGKDKLT